MTGRARSVYENSGDIDVMQGEREKEIAALQTNGSMDRAETQRILNLLDPVERKLLYQTKLFSRILLRETQQDPEKPSEPHRVRFWMSRLGILAAAEALAEGTEFKPKLLEWLRPHYKEGVRHIMENIIPRAAHIALERSKIRAEHGY